MATLIKRQTSLPAHAIQFGRYLRDNGFEIGPKEVLDLLEAFQLHVPQSIGEQQHLYKAIWVKNRRQYILFDELYESYWKELSRAEDSKTTNLEDKQKKSPQSKSNAPSLHALKNWLYGGRIEEKEEVAYYSAFEVLGQKDFAKFDTSEHRALLEIIRLIAKRLANKPNRRYTKSKASKVIDLKSTIQQSLKNGGTIDQLIFKKQQTRKVNIILLCDVSKSMELYSKFLIEFMYSFQQVVQQLKTFAFSTQLVSLSQILRDGNYDQALLTLSEQVPQWSGGTRIGSSLESFKTKYGNRLLNKDSIVVIVSDGWDTGDLDILEESMRYLHKKSHQLIWLNPLAGNPNYNPETKAMQLCLPHIDIFTAIHNLDSLKAVAKLLR